MAGQKVKLSLGDRILRKANDGYHNRDDFPPYAVMSWDDRLRWSAYIKKIADEIEREEG